MFISDEGFGQGGRGGFYAGLYWVWGVTRGPKGSAFSALGGVTRVRATRPLRGAISGVREGAQFTTWKWKWTPAWTAEVPMNTG